MALSFAVTPFLFPPDWSDDVLEHLEWRTDVLTAHDETEQRRSLRTKARRSFEYTLHATADRAPELEGLLFTKQNTRVAVPVWTDRARSTSSIAVGGSVVSVPTTNYAFASSQLVCFYVSETQYEFCRIAFVDSTSLTFDTPMASAWPAGTLIFPAVLAMLPKDAAVTRYTSNALTCRIELITSPDITYAFTPTDQTVFAAHNGLEVVLTQPNWRSPISNTFAVKYDIADGGTGAIVQMQTAPLSRRTHQYAWLLKNRDEILAYRNFLGRCKGQFKSFYVPSWHDDMRIVSVAPTGDSVTIEGQDWLGSGLTSVVLYDNLRQREYRNVTLAASGTNTVVTLDLPATIEVSDLRLLCPTRMLSDKVTLNWKSDGIVEVTNAMITGVGIAGSGDYVNNDVPELPPVAPLDSMIRILMQFNGTNGSTDFIDLAGHSLVASGSPVLSTTQSVSGGSSLYLNGTSYLQLAPGGRLTTLAAESFCIEAWVYGRPTGSILSTIVRLGAGGDNDYGWVAHIDGGNLKFTYHRGGQFTATFLSGNTDLPENQWNHVAISCTEAGGYSDFAFWLNGVADGTATGQLHLADSPFTPRIGKTYDTAYPTDFTGYIDNLRLTVGSPVYTANFTPPTS